MGHVINKIQHICNMHHSKRLISARSTVNCLIYIIFFSLFLCVLFSYIFYNSLFYYYLLPAAFSFCNFIIRIETRNKNANEFNTSVYTMYAYLYIIWCDVINQRLIIKDREKKKKIGMKWNKKKKTSLVVLDSGAQIHDANAACRDESGLLGI